MNLGLTKYKSWQNELKPLEGAPRDTSFTHYVIQLLKEARLCPPLSILGHSLSLCFSTHLSPPLTAHFL